MRELGVKWKKVVNLRRGLGGSVHVCNEKCTE